MKKMELYGVCVYVRFVRQRLAGIHLSQDVVQTQLRCTMHQRISRFIVFPYISQISRN